MASLLEAFGGPPRHHLVPRGRKSSALRCALDLVHGVLRRLGCQRRFSTCDGIFSVINNSAVPHGLTWGLLCGRHSVADLIAATHNATRHVDASVCFWNARWLVDPHTVASTKKRKCLTSAILRGQIVGVCETHWKAKDQAIWAHLFPTAAVLHCNAPSLHGQRAPGGVVLIIPPCYEIIRSRSVMDGYCLEATVRNKAKNQTLQCVVMYLLPGHRLSIIQAARSIATAEGVPTFLMGDLNYDYVAPRSQDECAIHHEMSLLLEQLHTSPLL